MIINATSPRTSDAYPVQNPIFSVQTYGNTSSGSGAAQLKVWGSNTTSAGVPWIPVCTIDIPLTTAVSGDGAVVEFSWKYVKLELVSISGTGAVVSAIGNGNYLA